MSRLSELRKRSNVTKELHEQKMARVKEVVMDTVNSSAFSLTAMNHMSEDERDENVDKFAEQVAERVANVVTDPVVEFIDTCKARGLKESRIRKAVDMIVEVFGLCDEATPYEEKLKSVAIYLHENPKLYDDISMLC